MQIRAVKSICFSPTGTTDKIIRAISEAIECDIKEMIDISLPDLRKNRVVSTSGEELIIIGIPVYAGRLPVIASKWIRTIKADRSPVVCVVLYGNREYDDALLELKELMEACGGITIAAAAFIGEHSFSSRETPIASSRPDSIDLRQATSFGLEIDTKLKALSDIEVTIPVTVPGNQPYKSLKEMPSDIFVTINDTCRQCGVCAESCPAGAISKTGSMMPAMDRCIICCACIKGCPEGARTMTAGPIRDVAIRLNKNCSDRKEPEIFI